MHIRADGCLATKSLMAHTSVNSTSERKNLSVNGCWAFQDIVHLQHIEFDLDLLSIHRLLPGGSSSISNIDVSNSTLCLHHPIHQE